MNKKDKWIIGLYVFKGNYIYIKLNFYSLERAQIYYEEIKTHIKKMNQEITLKDEDNYWVNVNPQTIDLLELFKE